MNMAELDAFAPVTGYTLLGLDTSIRTLELFGYYSHIRGGREELQAYE